MAFEIRYYTMLIHNKDDIEFVTEFPCLLGHPVDAYMFHLQRYPWNLDLETLDWAQMIDTN